MITARAGEKLVGFFSYFSCHPVSCCEKSYLLHGDYCGVASNCVGDEYDGAIGLFLQGALGDVNACVAHESQDMSLQALDVLAGRYARALREGVEQAEPFLVDRIACFSESVTFSRRAWSLADLKAKLKEAEDIIGAVPNDMCSSADLHRDHKRALSVVFANALRGIIDRMERDGSHIPPTELQGMAIGKVSILGSGFEVFQQIKREINAQAESTVPLVTGLVNDSTGYAPDRETADRGGYAVDQVPLMGGQIPYSNIHDELVEALLRIDTALQP